ncbi:Glutathione S-transferase, unnamed subgroup [hydrothermal vent metagenome]|uniref:Glutathione S-transferase, unnamed subgroup n=1 Tax=hydrothermal vent metagenome TaxID=652676 RepID=A0A3B0XB47_9ZZZZ
MIKLYDFPLSGHAHRVRLMLSLLDMDYELIHVKLDEGEHLEAAYSQLNRFQAVPVLDDNGFIVRDSVAIIIYLASKYANQWYPQDAESIAGVQEWLAIATREIAEGPASARLVNVFKADLDHSNVIEKSHKLLSIINEHLEGREWLALSTVSIADIAAYTYIAHAPEGDVSLESYPHILSWLQRVEALKGFVPMEKTRVGLAS